MLTGKHYNKNCSSQPRGVSGLSWGVSGSVLLLYMESLHSVHCKMQVCVEPRVQWVHTAHGPAGVETSQLCYGDFALVSVYFIFRNLLLLVIGAIDLTPALKRQRQVDLSQVYRGSSRTADFQRNPVLKKTKKKKNQNQSKDQKPSRKTPNSIALFLPFGAPVGPICDLKGLEAWIFPLSQLCCLSTYIISLHACSFP